MQLKWNSLKTKPIDNQKVILKYRDHSGNKKYTIATYDKGRDNFTFSGNVFNGVSKIYCWSEM